MWLQRRLVCCSLFEHPARSTPSPVTATVKLKLTASASTATSTSTHSHAPARSTKSCEELGWKFYQPTTSSSSDKRVCASSFKGSQCRFYNPFAAAVVTCSAAGARLCTAAELHGNVALGSGCALDLFYVWASDGCFLPTGRQGSLAVQGAHLQTLSSTSQVNQQLDPVCAPPLDHVRAGVRCCADAHRQPLRTQSTTTATATMATATATTATMATPTTTMAEGPVVLDPRPAQSRKTCSQLQWAFAPDGPFTSRVCTTCCDPCVL